MPLSMGSLSTASFYQAHLDRKHTLWNIVSTEISIYAPYAGAAGMLLHINGKFTTAELKSLSYKNKIPFLAGIHCVHFNVWSRHSCIRGIIFLKLQWYSQQTWITFCEWTPSIQRNVKLNNKESFVRFCMMKFASYE